MASLSGKPQLLREVNSSIIEQLVFENGPLSKPELAKRTGLSLTTISKLVDELEKSARLSPVGLSGKGAGRRAMLYETNRNSGCLLACYYREKSFQCRLADMMNNTLYEKRFPLDISTRKKALNGIVYAIDSLIERAPAKVKIIGVGLPGVVQPDGTIMAIPQISVWEGLNLEKELGGRYKGTAVYIGNNVRLSALGYFNAHRREQHEKLVYLYVGNGIGSGIIMDRQVYCGAANFSGEIGYMTEPRAINSRGHTLAGGYMESLMGNIIDYGTGEFKPKKRKQDAVDILGTIAVNYVAMLNPDVIVFAGKIFDDKVTGAIEKCMKNSLPPEIMPRITRDPSPSMGIDGLIQNCREYITTGTHLIQSNGLSRHSGRMNG